MSTVAEMFALGRRLKMEQDRNARENDARDIQIKEAKLRMNQLQHEADKADFQAQYGINHETATAMTGQPTPAPPPVPWNAQAAPIGTSLSPSPIMGTNVPATPPTPWQNEPGAATSGISNPQVQTPLGPENRMIPFSPTTIDAMDMPGVGTFQGLHIPAQTLTPLNQQQMAAVEFLKSRIAEASKVHEIPEGGMLSTGGGDVIQRNKAPDITIPQGLPGAGTVLPEKLAGPAMGAAARVQDTNSRNSLTQSEGDKNRALKAQIAALTHGATNDAAIAAYASDIATGKIDLSKVPMKDRGNVRSYMVGNGIEMPTPQNPASQTVLRETQPVMQQVDGLLATFEPMKDDNTPFKFAPEALKYKMGIASPIGQAGDAIANLNMLRIVGAARILKGGSRAVQALQMAAQHTPNVMTDSPKLIYEKLTQLRDRLTDIESAAQEHGNKFGVDGVNPPAQNGESNTAPEGTVIQIGGAMKVKRGGQWVNP